MSWTSDHVVFGQQRRLSPLDTGEWLLSPAQLALPRVRFVSAVVSYGNHVGRKGARVKKVAFGGKAQAEEES